MKQLGGKVLFLDRNDINTDEIIPARYLTEVDKKIMAKYLLEDLKMDGFDSNSPLLRQAKVCISRANFGCGSSREHAVWVFTENAYQVVIAENFARIFRQNTYNNGLLAIELSHDKIEDIYQLLQKDPDLEVLVELDSQKITVKSKIKNLNYDFEISPFYKEVVKAGGWIDFVDTKY